MSRVLVERKISVDPMLIPGVAGTVCCTTTLNGNMSTTAPIPNTATENVWLSSEGPPRNDQRVAMETPIGQRQEFDGAIPPGRSILRGRPRRRVLAVTRTPNSSPTMEIEFVDIIPSIP